ncbi:MBOAT family O-acyltransferase [Pantoea vagans]|uniref:MBOAT family O-acyltransferase n=1 Tax=Pantoea vagans TaxID=470934 RepID=UPI003B026EAC
MVFSSPAFLFIFFPAFLALYFLIARNYRNGLILVSSIFFYLLGAGLLVVVAMILLIINWLVALKMDVMNKRGTSPKHLLTIAVLINLAPLVFFKYLGFLLNVFNDLTGVKNLNDIGSLHLILPLGISFYVFHFISYLVDVYRKKIAPETDLKKFTIYIALFPHLIAGPLVRYSEVKQQLNVKHRRLVKSDLFWGMVIFSIGLAKKTIVADPLGTIVDSIHNSVEVTTYSAWLSAVCYSFQIYFDFSGYTDMAIGMARMIGFRFPQNFNRPYAAFSITEFWRRWHMTLSRWFRDYVYIPLGGNRTTEFKTYRNLFVVFGLCALWHGAAYTFLIWGLGHGALIAIERAGIINLKKMKLFSLPVFILATILWVPFRSTDLHEMNKFLAAMFHLGDIPIWVNSNLSLTNPKIIFLLVISFVICFIKDNFFFKLRFALFRNPLLLGGYCMLLYFLSCISLVEHGFNPFIYFQF